MVNPAKKKGTSLETWTVRYLAWALQDTRIDRMPLHGNADQGDLIGVRFCGEPVCVECKDTKQPNYRKHWRELLVEMANMDTPYGVLVQHRKGVGVKSLKGMARQMAVFDIETLERFLATHMGHVLGPDYRIRRELANRCAANRSRCHPIRRSCGCRSNCSRSWLNDGAYVGAG